MEDQSSSIPAPAPSATVRTTAEDLADPSGDFGHITPKETIKVDFSSLRVAVLYEAASTFECALAATLKCEKAVAALCADATDYGIVAGDLLSVDPHVIITLNDRWSRDLYARLGSLMTSKPCMLITLGSKPEGPPSVPEISYIDPGIFAKIAPCRKEVSAFIIFSHLMRGEFPRAFSDGLEDARFFRLAIRASTRTTLGAWQLVNEIISDWQRVMEPDNLVMYGRFIANVGPNIAQGRIKDHSVVIVFGEPKVSHVRVVECPDFEEITGKVALTVPFGSHKVDAVITYSLSADTTTCKLVCCPAETVDAREILARLTPNPSKVSVSAPSFEVSMAASDFFAIIRKMIVNLRDELSPEILGVIKEGEQALMGTIAASKTP